MLSPRTPRRQTHQRCTSKTENANARVRFFGWVLVNGKKKTKKKFKKKKTKAESYECPEDYEADMEKRMRFWYTSNEGF